MEQEVSEKDEKQTITATIPGIPQEVHRKIMRYRRKINLERNQDYKMMESYTEFLIEATKGMPE